MAKHKGYTKEEQAIRHFWLNWKWHVCKTYLNKTGVELEVTLTRDEFMQKWLESGKWSEHGCAIGQWTMRHDRTKNVLSSDSVSIIQWEPTLYAGYRGKKEEDSANKEAKTSKMKASKSRDLNATINDGGKINRTRNKVRYLSQAEQLKLKVLPQKAELINGIPVNSIKDIKDVVDPSKITILPYQGQQHANLYSRFKPRAKSSEELAKELLSELEAEDDINAEDKDQGGAYTTAD